jgi:hypothetical protein
MYRRMPEQQMTEEVRFVQTLEEAGRTPSNKPHNSPEQQKSSIFPNHGSTSTSLHNRMANKMIPNIRRS